VRGRRRGEADAQLRVAGTAWHGAGQRAGAAGAPATSHGVRPAGFLVLARLGRQAPAGGRDRDRAAARVQLAAGVDGRRRAALFPRRSRARPRGAAGGGHGLLDRRAVSAPSPRRARRLHRHRGRIRRFCGRDLAHGEHRRAGAGAEPCRQAHRLRRGAGAARERRAHRRAGHSHAGHRAGTASAARARDDPRQDIEAGRPYHGDGPPFTATRPGTARRLRLRPRRLLPRHRRRRQHRRQGRVRAGPHPDAAQPRLGCRDRLGPERRSAAARRARWQRRW
jgi:hypothetical protein